MEPKDDTLIEAYEAMKNELRELGMGEAVTDAELAKSFDVIELADIDEAMKVRYAGELVALQDGVMALIAEGRAEEIREATEMMVSFLKAHEKIYTTRDDERTEMWIYKDGIYVRHGKTHVRQFVRLVLGAFYTSFRANEVISKLEADSYVDSEWFFGHENSIEMAMENGVLNVFTRALRPFSCESFFFNKIPVWYDPEAKCPAVDAHLSAVLKHPDDVKVMYEVFGYTLFKKYPYEKAIMLVGDGRNGKSKTVELLKRFLGPENCANIPLQQLEDDPFAMSELFGKLANLSADLPKTALKQTGNFKSLTGGDLISAARKFLVRLHFVNYAKMIFCANELPRTYDQSPAFWRRWILFEFPFTFVSKEEYDQVEDRGLLKVRDVDIIEKISTPSELSGLLNAALDGLKRLMDSKDFSYSRNTEQVKTMWIRRSDSFQAFVMDKLIMEYGAKTTKKEMRIAYTEYCTKNKVRPVSDKSIASAMADAGVVGDRVQSQTDQYEYVHVWDGVRIHE